ncbi:MAG TPA: phosphotransferase enzyme family protein, partial [Marinilabiliaceae bacterium]|nr:phosphotransferase enzyme family protein [Marinilabiliaceae bacterium]
MEASAKERVIALFEQWSGETAEAVSKLPASGSYRRYYRITGKTSSVLGAVNKDVKENRTFIEFSRFFHDKGLKVPEIYVVDAEMDCYLLEDLGNTTLFDWLSTARRGKEIPSAIVDFYKSCISQLIEFQTIGKNLDFSLCHPREKFDKQSMMWDLHYFKYYFLKLARISFDEQLLEDDFNRFTEYLLNTDCSYFMYRDFQSRNIMVVDNKPAFIDYQGGRMGALQYDLASLLYDAKADLPQSLRNELLNHYIMLISQKTEINESQFRETFNAYVLIRIMQAMGAYGFRGFYEKKEHFLKSIPFAMNNINYILTTQKIPDNFPTLYAALREITHNERLLQISAGHDLTVTINSNRQI